MPDLVHWSEQSYRSVFDPVAPERILWVIEDNGELQAFLAARFSAADCEVRESNQAARALYVKLGFQENGRRRGYYPQPQEDAILLTLRLNCTASSAPER